MIERIKIKNFRCLVDCEIPLEPITLFLGENGSGKSSVLDVLHLLQTFVAGGSQVSHTFSVADLTRWEKWKADAMPLQTLALDVRLPEGLYRYTLTLELDRDLRQCKVWREVLSLDDSPLCQHENGVFKLHADQSSRRKWLVTPDRSMLSVLPKDRRFAKLTSFREYISDMMVVRPIPAIMTSDSEKESENLDHSCANFASWCRFMWRNDFHRQAELFSQLADVFEGFDQIKIVGPADATATMRVELRRGKASKSVGYKLAELSDGQRQLLVLYTLLYGIDNRQRSLVFDEPDNYLSMREIQPWLLSLTDSVGQEVAQTIIVSHHPEILNQFGSERGIWFTRDEGGATRVTRRQLTANDPMTPSELVARGW